MTLPLPLTLLPAPARPRLELAQEALSYARTAACKRYGSKWLRLRGAGLRRVELYSGRRLLASALPPLRWGRAFDHVGRTLWEARAWWTVARQGLPVVAPREEQLCLLGKGCTDTRGEPI